MKKPEFLYPFARLTVDESEDAYASVPFLSSDSFGDEEVRALAAPSSWSGESVALMAEAACQNIPFELRTIEENTIPSWLWRRQGKGTRRARETDLRDIFNRAVGSAVAKAWKLSLFTTEKHARTFYDEARNALMQRHITLLPEIIAPWGLSWAYGIENVASPSSTSLKLKQTRISNAAIDAMIGKKKMRHYGKNYSPHKIKKRHRLHCVYKILQVIGILLPLIQRARPLMSLLCAIMTAP